jgi:hypothetical protein
MPLRGPHVVDGPKVAKACYNSFIGSISDFWRHLFKNILFSLELFFPSLGIFSFF